MGSTEAAGLRGGRGMLLGSFLPPHRGHLFLAEFAHTQCDDLVVVLCSRPEESISGALRKEWLRELMPWATVVHLEGPGAASLLGDAPWSDEARVALERALPFMPELLFGSDASDAKLAEKVGARFVPVDLERAAVPIHGAQIRNAPWQHWEHLPRCVRPHYVRRLAVVGPEHCGKTTLARQLAEFLKTTYVPEYGRMFFAGRKEAPTAEDFGWVARGQHASEEALMHSCNRVLVCDTDLLSAALWSEAVTGRSLPWLREAARRARYDLTLLCAPDLPVPAGAPHHLPVERRAFFETCRAELEALGRRYVVVGGEDLERFYAAEKAVEGLLLR